MARQLVFLDGWVKPLFQSAAILYPGAKGRLAALQECRESCRRNFYTSRLSRTSLGSAASGQSGRSTKIWAARSSTASTASAAADTAGDSDADVEA